MAMHVPRAPGFSSMLKDGAKHFSGLDEAIFRNIEACKELGKTIRSTYGPYGMNKMIINHIDKLFVTGDAATIMSELEVQHPAAKLLVLACKMQEQEAGDGTNWVLIFASSLLEHAENILRMGLTPTEVVEGYELAYSKAQELLEKLVVREFDDMRDVNKVKDLIKTSIASKQFGYEDFLAGLIADACIKILPPQRLDFNVDNVRVCKILGSGLLCSSVVNGMVFKRSIETTVCSVKKANVCVLSCPFDSTHTETKGTVLIKSAEELKSFSRGEDSLLESQVKALVDCGVTVVVTGGKVGELALHYANKYKLMVVKLTSKFDLRRLCKTVAAIVLPKMVVPTPDELGYCDAVFVDEVGDTPVIVFKQEKEESRVSTIIVRGSTSQLMDDIERAIDDGVNNYKVLTKNRKLLAGGSAVEMELARLLTSYSETLSGLEQYSVKSYAQSFEVVSKALAENSGLKATELISKLYASHQEGHPNHGFDANTGSTDPVDTSTAGILDLLGVKESALRLATNSACTVLRVDQIIMSKPAGGPKPKDNPNWDED